MITVASKLKSVVLCTKIDGVHSGRDDHGHIETQKCWVCLGNLMVFLFNVSMLTIVAPKLKSAAFAD